VISVDKSAAGPAGRGVVLVVDVPAEGVVVVVAPDFPLLPLEQADASNASTEHAIITADDLVRALGCTRLAFRPAASTIWERNDAPSRTANPTAQGDSLMATVSVRYIVNDVDEAIAFYCGQLGFHEEMHPAPTFAMLSKGDLRLVLSAPGGGPGGGQAMPDGSVPVPGGWNRFTIEVNDLAATVDRLRANGAHFRNDIVIGVGGDQILLDDPSGNPIELFQPKLPEAKLNQP